MFDLEESKVNPGLQEVAHTDKHSVDNDMPPSVFCFRTFRLPDRDARAECTDSEADNKASNDELRKLEARAL